MYKAKKTRNKARLFIEIEFDIENLLKTDEGLEPHEIANETTIAFDERIKEIVAESPRNAKVTSSKYEYTINHEVW